MGAAGRELVGAWTVTTDHWVRCAMFVTHCYASLMDPRPDLAMPARSVRFPYFWWW